MHEARLICPSLWSPWSCQAGLPSRTEPSTADASETATSRRRYAAAPGHGWRERGDDGAALEVLGLGAGRRRADPGRGAAAARVLCAAARLARGRAASAAEGGGDRAARAAAAAAGERRRSSAPRSPTSASPAPTASPSRTPCARSRATSTMRPISLQNLAPSRTSSPCWSGPRGRRRGHPVRRRVERRGRRRAGGGRRLRGRDQPRSARPRPGPRGRSREPRRARPGRHAGAGPRSRAQAAWADASPLPPELRVLDRRRLDRDPLGRPLRDPLHPRRRLRRRPARGDARRRDREPPPARLGRGAEPRSPADRLRGRARRDHRGLAAPAAAAELPGRRGGRVRRSPDRRERGARDRAGRALPVQPAPGRRRGMPRQRRQRRQLRAARARLRIGRPPGRRLAGARARAGPRPRRPRAAGRRARRGLAQRLHPHALQPRRPGARPGSSPTPSRPRSPGIGSRPCTPR